MSHRRRNPAEVAADADLIGPHLQAMVDALRACDRMVSRRITQQDEASSRSEATYLHLYEDLEEIAYLVKVANRSVREGAALAPQVREILGRHGQHTYNAESEEAMVLSLDHEYRTEVLVLNKAIHEWFNHVSVTLKLNQSFLSTVSPELRRKLSYVVLIRDKLLTHKKDLRKFRSGATYYENLATARVHRIPMGLPDEIIAEINGIFRGSLDKIPKEHQAEENVYVQFALLAEFHDDLQNHYRVRVKSLVEGYGAECVSLEELAHFGAQFSQEVLLPLAESIAEARDDS